MAFDEALKEVEVSSESEAEGEEEKEKEEDYDTVSRTTWWKQMNVKDLLMKERCYSLFA